MGLVGRESESESESRVACCCWALGGKSTDGLMGTPQWAGDLEEAVAARAWLTGVSCRQQM